MLAIPLFLPSTFTVIQDVDNASLEGQYQSFASLMEQRLAELFVLAGQQGTRFRRAASVGSFTVQVREWHRSPPGAHLSFCVSSNILLCAGLVSDNPYFEVFFDIHKANENINRTVFGAYTVWIFHDERSLIQTCWHSHDYLQSLNTSSTNYSSKEAWRLNI